jgi:hypothetical protein
MRLVGIVAVFGLALISVVEGAVLFKVSQRVDDLSAQLEQLREEQDLPAVPRLSDPSRPARGGAHTRPPVPVFATVTPPAADAPASATVLHQALATPEGREQLKSALSVIKEEERQTRLAKDAVEQDEDDQKFRDKLFRLAPLAPHEQQQVRDQLSRLAETRRRIIDDMKAGLKNAGQADDEIDDAEDNVEKSVRALVGDQRWKAFRDADRKERDARRRERESQPKG